MVTRKRGHTLERWEVALVKAMLATKRYNDQDILAYFTRPTRSINHRAIAEIRTETKHKALKPASADQLREFLEAWPDVEPDTGLCVRGDELLIKAREAMIAAVHTFNSAGLTFRAEIFMTTAMIAWTYLAHAWFKREGVDYRYKQNGAVKTLKSGAEAYWDLTKCLKHPNIPVSVGTKRNLEFLIEIRHEIEHRSTNRIDDALGAKLQACCLNFNAAIREWFGAEYGLERRLPLALQFVTFDTAQRANLKKAADLPAAIASTLDAFHEKLTDEELADPAFAFRVAFVPKVGSKASKADLAVEFVKADSEMAEAINQVLLKEVDKARYTAGQVVELMHNEGYPQFGMGDHTKLWQSLEAKEPAKGFGREGDYKNTWVWFDSWVARVRAHCQENAERYIAAAG
ncbi:MAG TPA: DUF3644 domain-containing protein [Sphingomicrobium sp.]